MTTFFENMRDDVNVQMSLHTNQNDSLLPLLRSFPQDVMTSRQVHWTSLIAEIKFKVPGARIDSKCWKRRTEVRRNKDNRNSHQNCAPQYLFNWLPATIERPESNLSNSGLNANFTLILRLSTINVIKMQKITIITRYIAEYLS